VPSGELIRTENQPSLAEPVKITIDPPPVIKPVNANNYLAVALVKNRADYHPDPLATIEVLRSEDLIHISALSEPIKWLTKWFPLTTNSMSIEKRQHLAMKNAIGQIDRSHSPVLKYPNLNSRSRVC
jgi:hypothetical protein